MDESARLRHFLNRNLLLGVVFVTGACVLVIEVLATRILSPYFGNTIFTFSSVIGIVLAALSAGYYVGGRTADRRPSEDLFYGIIGASGLSVLLLAGISRGLLPLWAYLVPLTTGPLLSSVILFAPPSFLLGLLSPFAIKLQQRRAPEVGIGNLTGSVFFWSTLGSISGSLGAGFVLIPNVGVHGSLVGVALVLLLIGGAGIAGQRISRKRKTSLGGTAAFVVLLSIALSRLLEADPGLIYRKDGTYERISVYEEEMNDRAVTSLYLDRNIVSAVYRDSDELVFDYAHYFRLVDFYVPQVKRVLVLGAGAYTVPRALLARYPDVRVDVVDIEPSLVALSKRYFGLEDDERLTRVVEDGRRFLHDAEARYDLIFGDAFATLFFVPPHLATREFFSLVRDRLSPGGIFVGNLVGSLSRERPSLLLSEMRTLRSVFPNSSCFATRSRLTLDAQNIMLLGVNGDRDVDYCAAAVDAGGDAFARTLCRTWVDGERYEYDEDPVFTDDYAPVEVFSARLVSMIDSRADGFDGSETAALLRQLEEYGTREEIDSLLRAELRALGFGVDGNAGGGVLGRSRRDSVHPTLVAASTDDPAAMAVLLEAARQLALREEPAGVGLLFVDAAGDSGADLVVRDVCEAGGCTSRALKAAGSALLQRLPPPG